MGVPSGMSASGLGMSAATNGIGAGVVSPLGGASLPTWAQANSISAAEAGEALGMVAVSSASTLYPSSASAISKYCQSEILSIT